MKSINVIVIKNTNNNIPNGIVINNNQGKTPQKQLDSLQDSFVIKLHRDSRQPAERPPKPADWTYPQQNYQR